MLNLSVRGASEGVNPFRYPQLTQWMCPGASFTFPASILSVSLSLRIFIGKFCITFCTRKLVSLLGPCSKTGQSNVKSEGHLPPFRILGFSHTVGSRPEASANASVRSSLFTRSLAPPRPHAPRGSHLPCPLSFPRSRLSARRGAADDLPRHGGLSSARPFSARPRPIRIFGVPRQVQRALKGVSPPSRPPDCRVPILLSTPFDCFLFNNFKPLFNSLFKVLFIVRSHYLTSLSVSVHPI